LSVLPKLEQKGAPEQPFGRNPAHFLRNALDHLPCKADDECLLELRWHYDRQSVEEPVEFPADEVIDAHDLMPIGNHRVGQMAGEPEKCQKNPSFSC
jgi:hypothetical protein